MGPVRIWWILPLVLAAGCTKSSTSQGAVSDVEWFTDRAHETGLDFVHFNGMTGRFYQPEIMAPGVA